MPDQEATEAVRGEQQRSELQEVDKGLHSFRDRTSRGPAAIAGVVARVAGAVPDRPLARRLCAREPTDETRFKIERTVFIDIPW